MFPPIFFCSNMSQKQLSEYMCVSKDFDVQLEAYLLSDSKRREQAESKTDLGSIYTSGPKVMPYEEHIKRGWLTIKGAILRTLVDGEEIVLTVFANTDGHFMQAAIVKIWKEDDDEARLVYRESRVILKRLGSKCTTLREFWIKDGTYMLFQSLLKGICLKAY